MTKSDIPWEQRAADLHRTIRWSRIEAGLYTATHRGVDMFVERRPDGWTYRAWVGGDVLYPEWPHATAREAKAMVAWQVELEFL